MLRRVGGSQNMALQGERAPHGNQIYGYASYAALPAVYQKVLDGTRPGSNTLLVRGLTPTRCLLLHSWRT